MQEPDLVTANDEVDGIPRVVLAEVLRQLVHKTTDVCARVDFQLRVDRSGLARGGLGRALRSSNVSIPIQLLKMDDGSTHDKEGRPFCGMTERLLVAAGDGGGRRLQPKTRPGIGGSQAQVF